MPPKYDKKFHFPNILGGDCPQNTPQLRGTWGLLC